MERKLTTQQKILLAALELFSTKGYDASGVDEIAAAVGLSGPAIYYHFRSKDDILDALGLHLDEYYRKVFGFAADPSAFPSSGDSFVAGVVNLIGIAVRDPIMRMARRMLTMEQYRSDRFREMATRHFATGLATLYSRILEQMMDAQLIIREEPELLATVLLAPLQQMVHLTDREPDREPDAMKHVELFAVHFWKTYGKEARA